MKKINFAIVASVAAMAISGSATAAHVSPANSGFTVSGDAELVKPGVGTLNCNLTFGPTGNLTGPDVGGVHANHANGGTLGAGSNTGTGCVPLTVDSGVTFTVTSYDPILDEGTVDLQGIVVRYGGTAICSSSGAISAPVYNTPSGAVVVFDASFGGCTVYAELQTSLNIVN